MRIGLFVMLLAAAAVLAGCATPFQPPVQPPEVAMRPALVVETDLGAFVAVLYESETPRTVAQMTRLAEEGFFNGSRFNRVVDNFVIQGGDPPSGRSEAPTLPLETHPALWFGSGAVGMARDVSPDSATSVFFVCEYPQPHLRDPEPGLSAAYGRFTVFGQVVNGTDVVRALAGVRTNKPLNDEPVAPLEMSAYVTQIAWTAELDERFPTHTIGRVAAPPYRVALETARVVRAGELAYLAWFAESQVDRSAETRLSLHMRIDGPERGTLALQPATADSNVHMLAEPFPSAGSYVVTLTDGLRDYATFTVAVAPPR